MDMRRIERPRASRTRWAAFGAAAGLVLAAGILVSAGTFAQDVRQASPAQPADGWHFELAPYGWFAGMSGTMGVGPREAQTRASFTDICHNLDSAFMAHFEGRKEAWGFVLDPIYINLGASVRTPYGFKIAVNVEQFMMGFEGTYRAYEKDGNSLDVLFGGRYSALKSDLTPSGVPLPSYHFSKGWVDPMVGFRGRFDLGRNWTFGIRGDVGGFGVGSKLAWDAMAYFDLQASKAVSFSIGYSAVATDYESGSGATRFLYDIRMDGPFVGVGFRF
jgi:hypothetical protein